MPLVDLIDETFLVAPPAAVAVRLGDPGLWQRCWPEVELAVYQDRGLAGLRWTVSGELSGTAEVWLEPFRDGVVVHCYLRADPVRSGRARGQRRRAAALRRRYSESIKRHLNSVKDELERGRAPGTGRPPPPPVPVKRAAGAAES